LDREASGTTGGMLPRAARRGDERRRFPWCIDRGDPGRAADQSQGDTTISRFSILLRLVFLCTVLLGILMGSVFLLSREVAHRTEATSEQADVIATMRAASATKESFDELKYWLTDLAVSLVMRSERKAYVARDDLNAWLDLLEPRAPDTVAAIRKEVAAMIKHALAAADAYGAGDRVTGNAQMTESRDHIRIVEERLDGLMNRLESEAMAKNVNTQVAANAAVVRALALVMAGSIFGIVLTVLILRSITVPLRGLVEAMAAITTGNLKVRLPKPGRDEIGSMIRTLALFRDSLAERDRLAAEHQRAEKQIRDLAAFPEQSPNPVLRFAWDDVLMYANEASRPLLDGMGCAVGEPAPAAWAAALRQAASTGAPGELEFECGGRLYLVVLRAERQAGYINAYAHDITERKHASEEVRRLNEELEKRVEERTKALTEEVMERKRAEELLRESEARFRDIAESTSDCIWEMDADLRFSYFSDRFAEMAGIDPTKILGRTRLEVGQGDPNEEKWQHHLADLEARRPFRDFRYKFVAGDGRDVHFSVSGKPVFDEDGRFQGYRGTGTDITAQVEAEERARSAQERLALAIEALSENFVLFDADDRIVISNQAWRNLGTDVAEWTQPGTPFVDHLHAAVRAHLIPEAVGREEEWIEERLARHRNPGKPFELERQNGLWVLINEQRLPDGGTVLISTDITERKQAEERRRAEEARFRAVVDNSPTKIHIKDAEGRYVLINRLAETLFGVSEAEALGRTSADIFSPALAKSAQAHDRAVIESGETVEQEEIWEMADGHHTFLTVKFPIPDANGGVAAVGAIGTDITERKQAEERLRLLTHAIEQSSSMVLITDRDGIIVYVNKQFETITGYTAAEVIGRTPKVTHQSEVIGDKTYDELWADLKSGRMWQGEILNMKKDGDFHWVAETISPIKDDKGEITHFLSVKDDITERKRAKAQIEHLALHDSLTNLPNRFLFHDRLHKAVAQSTRTGTSLALLFLDLDDFKDVNDTLGHDVGDKLLKAVAGRLQSFIRDSDGASHRNTTLARLGGDEFTVLLTSLTDPHGAATIAERIIDDLSAPFAVGRNQIHTGVSIGIAVHPGDGADPEQLLKNADLALYRSKSEGRNMYRFYSREMGASVVARKDLEWDLRRAMERHELWLAYQPQADVHSGRMIGMEALLRWNHPGRGVVTPGDFIGIAEATGMIVSIGEWVLRMACTQNKLWQDAGLPKFPVAVNLSAVQFRQSDVVATVSRALADAGLDPAYLNLEITESVVMQDSRTTKEKLQDLSDLGIKVALDDFGTGYSSLSYLTQFPVGKIKLDRSFVQDIAHDTSNAAIVKAVVTLGHNLGMRVNVEGVETPEQMAILGSYGVDEIQGYLFSRPLGPDDVPLFLAENLTATGSVAKIFPGVREVETDAAPRETDEAETQRPAAAGGED